MEENYLDISSIDRLADIKRMQINSTENLERTFSILGEILEKDKKSIETLHNRVERLETENTLQFILLAVLAGTVFALSYFITPN